ncbi:MAG: hypothetical protein LYZ70_01020 [Nitrososphaerales archaeon]|nr:hypothetical protein [Nitrososphaerales archaeon]
MIRSKQTRAHAKALGLVASLLLLSMSGVGSVAATAPALDIVQVSLQTAQSLRFQYTFTAYNSSGYQVAWYESSHPGAAFQLPSGSYLVTASAYYYNSTVCVECPLGASPVAKGSAGVASISPRYQNPYNEYGFAVAKVSGASSLSIKTQNASAIPLSSLTIHVGYANGTAASRASVSGYVVGSYYVYSPKMVTCGETGKDGNVVLTMPQAPVDISAYLSTPIVLPKNTTTVTVEVGGQKVNVTVYLQPSYLNLFGQALVLPPQTRADVVLQYRPFNEPIIYYANGAPTVATAGGVAPTGSTVTTTQTGGAAVQARGLAQAATRIAPFNASGGEITTVDSGPAGVINVNLVVAAIGAAVVVAGFAALWLRKSAKKAPPS